MSDMYSSSMENVLDWKRIRHLFKLGIIAAITVLVGDMLLGWGTADAGLAGAESYFSRYLSVSDSRIFWSALLGLIGIPVETMSYFGIYRLIASRSPKQAHAYRAGLIGMLTFGALVHVICCVAVYYFKKMNAVTPGSAAADAVRFASYFLLPATVMFAAFFFITAGVQIAAFAGNNTPYPKWCLIFNGLSGFVVIAIMKLIGNYPLSNALSTGWISLGSIFMLSGLLIMSKKAEGAYENTH